MKSLSKFLTIFFVISGLTGYSVMPVLAVEETLDEINTTLIQARLKDCCGDDLRESDLPNRELATKENLEFPPAVSECCAYDNTALVSDVDKDEVTIVYTATPELDQIGRTARLLIHDDQDQVVYEKLVQPSTAQALYQEVVWPLTTTSGGALNVGREGKQYKSTIEILKDNVVESRSGSMPIFVDDCDVRQQAIRDLKSNPDVFQDEGYHWYIDLEDAVATEICKRIRNGLVRQQGPNDGFSNRCHYQCINNYFTNLIVDFSLQPTNSNNVWANAHRQALWYRRTIGVFGPALNSAPFFGEINAKQENLEIMSLYVSAENYLRAEGYYKCGGVLNFLDRDISINLISEIVRGFISAKGYPFDAVSNVVGGVSEFIGRKLAVEHNLDLTDEYYVRRRNGEQIIEGVYPL